MALFLFIVLIVPAMADLQLTDKEKEWIRANPTVIVGGELDWPPFDFVGPDGTYQGITNDYLQLVSERTGLKFNIITGYTWKQLV
ncbi:MAG: transporter substrate-binding domain-containing protein, partial [Sulfurimonadaceae bacterium]|nr:transporter substrate-binding domain-containing protein [Sulfurimonadaceae bacterium]